MEYFWEAFALCAAAYGTYIISYAGVLANSNVKINKTTPWYVGVPINLGWIAVPTFILAKLLEWFIPNVIDKI